MKRTSSVLLFSLLPVLLLLLPTGNTLAQDFTVRHFRILPNDISAYIDPVRDLNDEACALIKVVGDKDFVFSSPLGIVKRKNDVGEIWLYLPKGSVMITIKHPQWGVLRDYRFAAPLESRMTYELMLTPPLGYQYPVEMPTLEKQPVLPDTSLYLAKHLPPFPPQRPRRPREPWRRLILLNAGIQADGLRPDCAWHLCGDTVRICWHRKIFTACLIPRANATGTDFCPERMKPPTTPDGQKKDAGC